MSYWLNVMLLHILTPSVILRQISSLPLSTKWSGSAGVREREGILKRDGFEIENWSFPWTLWKRSGGLWYCEGECVIKGFEIKRRTVSSSGMIKETLKRVGVFVHGIKCFPNMKNYNFQMVSKHQFSLKI